MEVSQIYVELCRKVPKALNADGGVHESAKGKKCPVDEAGRKVWWRFGKG